MTSACDSFSARNESFCCWQSKKGTSLKILQCQVTLPRFLCVLIWGIHWTTLNNYYDIFLLAVRFWAWDHLLVLRFWAWDQYQGYSHGILSAVCFPTFYFSTNFKIMYFVIVLILFSHYKTLLKMTIITQAFEFLLQSSTFLHSIHTIRP